MKDPIGHATCPECNFPDAEIKTDKGGKPYRYCPDCAAQYFTRGHPGADKRLLATMRPAGSPTPAAPPASPGARKKTAAVPFSLDDLK